MHALDALDVFAGGLLAAATLRMGDVAGGDLGDREALANLGAHLRLGDQPPQLRLGLRSRQAGAFAARALGADAALHAPPVRVPRAVVGLAAVPVDAHREAAGAVRAARTVAAASAGRAGRLGICGGGHWRQGTPERAHRPVLDGGCTVQSVSELRLRRHAPGRSSGAGATYVGLSAQHSTRTHAPRLGSGPRRRPRHHARSSCGSKRT